MNISTSIVYLLHLHKAGGTSVCAMAKTLYATPLHSNCNVPQNLWFEPPSQTRYQHAAYFGNTIDQMTHVHHHVRSNGWAFAANEGSLEDAFPFEPYFYITMLRHPVDLYISAYLFMPGFGGGVGRGTSADFRHWLDVGWYGDNFMTRRLCGHSCDSINTLNTTMKNDHLVPVPITLVQYKRALSNLRKFNVVIILENFQAGINALATLRPEWKHHATVHKNSAKNNPHQQIRDDPEAMNDLKHKVHFDMLLYAAATSMS